MRKLLFCCLLFALAAAAQERPAQSAASEAEPGLAPPPMVRSFEARPIYRLSDEDIKPPIVLKQPDPPPLKNFGTAKVILWCVVGTDGKAHLISIAKHYSLEADMKAVENLKEWKFKPGRKKTDNVDVLTTQEVVWQ
jgi:hypothetical protein